MSYALKDFIELLKEEHLLLVIDKEVDLNVEIAHIAYIESKKKNSKALLFTSPMKDGKKLKTPVLLNCFANERALELVLGAKPDEIAMRIEKLLKTHMPRSLSAGIDLAKTLYPLLKIAPKRRIGHAPCKEREYKLSELPILKTWPHDGGYFITMGATYTKKMGENVNNMGMYRLQVHEWGDGEKTPDLNTDNSSLNTTFQHSLKTTKISKDLDEQNQAQNMGDIIDDSTNLGSLLLHWQIHKDGAHFYHDYKKSKKRMEVAIAIGAHPLHIFCGQAPLPPEIFELTLFGFIKNSPARLVKCDTVDIYVPQDSDFVIEGYVDCASPNHSAIEGPFGDHTGFYTPQDLFPIMKISKITGKKDAIFQATVVGKPPLEDKYMGLGTERIFLPLLRAALPDLLDYKMPENGVFHNLILAKYRASYPHKAAKLMHAFWGLGQMAFVKHAIFVSEKAPDLANFKELAKYVLDRLRAQDLLITQGIIDELDHATSKPLFGGKLGIDVGDEESTLNADRIAIEGELARQGFSYFEPINDTKMAVYFISDGGGGAAKKADLGSLKRPKNEGENKALFARDFFGKIGEFFSTKTSTESSIKSSEKTNTNSHSQANTKTITDGAEKTSTDGEKFLTIMGRLEAAANSANGDASAADNSANAAAAALLALFQEPCALFLFDQGEVLENSYMRIWQACNNIDAKRDISIQGQAILIDCRSKKALFALEHRFWPEMTACDENIVQSLIARGLLENDKDLFEKYEIFRQEADI